jgi:hypothetical protein
MDSKPLSLVTASILGQPLRKPLRKHFSVTSSQLIPYNVLMAHFMYRGEKFMNNTFYIKYFLAVTGVSLISGCASTPDDYSPFIHDQSQNVQLYDEGSAPDGDWKILNEVTSNSCNSKTKDHVEGDEQEARQLLSLEAAKINASAVIDVKCWTSKVNLKSNCWSAIKCKGLAVEKK